MKMMMLSHSHCRHYYLYAFCFRSVMYYFLKWKREGRKYFCTNDPELIFSHILEAWQYCTPIAHLDTTWTAGCLLVWGAGASVTIETTGASARRLEASRGGLWRIWKPRERNLQLWLNLVLQVLNKTQRLNHTARHRCSVLSMIIRRSLDSKDCRKQWGSETKISFYSSVRGKCHKGGTVYV